MGDPGYAVVGIACQAFWGILVGRGEEGRERKKKNRAGGLGRW